MPMHAGLTEVGILTPSREQMDRAIETLIEMLDACQRGVLPASAMPAVAISDYLGYASIFALARTIASSSMCCSDS